MLLLKDGLFLANNVCMTSPPLFSHAQVKLVGKKRLVLDLSCRQRDGRWVMST